MIFDIYLGIDVGKGGAVVGLNERGEMVLKSRVPLIGDDYDKRGMLDVLGKWSVKHAVLEDVHAIFGTGAASTFDFGRGKGLWEMGLMCMKVPHTLVQPKEWQREIWVNSDKCKSATKRINKLGNAVEKVDTKATSLTAARRLFPDGDFRSSDRARMPHDGIVDALLMAEYCRRRFR